MTNGIESGRTATTTPECIERQSGTSGETGLSNVDRNSLLAERIPANPVTAETTNLELYDSGATPPISGLRYPLRDGECDPRGPSFAPGAAEAAPQTTPTDSTPPTPRPVFPPPFYPTPGAEGMPIGRPGAPRDGEVVPNNKPKPGVAEGTITRTVPPIPTPPYMSPR